MRRIFTPSSFLNDLWFLLSRSPGLIGVARDERLTRAMVEKIMIVTTAVNGCSYCAWYHARAAVAVGVSSEEVESLFELQFHADASEFEMMALLYAQHYAETNRQPDDEMTARLVETYGDATARHIVLVIRMITFGNLVGNTWDAALSRFRGRPALRSQRLRSPVRRAATSVGSQTGENGGA